ncbi:MAG: transcription antitermination factor NusB [Erysipelotrichaceae bacterium]|nr:transcription antitermination factor NusB [Erysipelotrichaceae bacterium]MDD3808719.1 transcription antitermination factor NusB [Erysipelotrichaceae bacterium]
MSEAIKVRKKVIREKAIIAIYQYLMESNDRTDVINNLVNDPSLKNREHEINDALFLVENTLGNFRDYQVLIKQNLKPGWTIKRLSKMELAIMLIGVCEIVTNTTPKTVVINEAVNIAKKYCDDDSYKFINGVLNQIG